MLRNMIIGVAAFTVFTAACGSAADPNTNSNSNTNTIVNIDNANLPEGLSTEPIKPSANTTPGINVSGPTKVPSDVSPAEGIPSADELRKARKPGATPTPGIPGSMEEATKKASETKEVKTVTAPTPADSSATGERPTRSQRPQKP